MPPKDSKKGGGKQLLLLTQLTALQATYKAASRRYGVAPVKSISVLLEDSIQEQAHITKVSLQGPDIQWQHLAAVLDGMAGYPGVKNLCLWSCSIGDEGIVRVAQLLKSSANDKWWRGSKIKHLEICGDGSGQRPEKWSDTYMSHISGGLPSEGPGYQLPNLLLKGDTALQGTARTEGMGETGSVGKSVEKVTLDTLKLCDQLGGPLYDGRYDRRLDLAIQRQLEAELRRQAVTLTNPAATTSEGGQLGDGEGAGGEGPGTRVPGEGEEEEAGDEDRSAAQQAVAALQASSHLGLGTARGAWGGTASTSGLRTSATGDAHATGLFRSLSKTAAAAASGQLLRSLPAVPPTPGGAGGSGGFREAWVPGSGLLPSAALAGSASGGFLPSSLQLPPGSSVPSPLDRLQQRLVTGHGVAPMDASAGGRLLTAATYQAQDQARVEQREWLHASRRQQGLPPLPGAPDDPHRTSTSDNATPTTTLGFAATGGLRASGGGAAEGRGEGACASLPSFLQPRPLTWSPPALKELSLGLSVLGLTLQVLSLDHNQLGNVGARILAQGLKRCMNLQHLSLEDCGIGPVGAEALADTMAPGHDSTPEQEALRPKYIALNLSRNPLGGLGLAALSLGLRHCPSLRIINLADTQLTEDDTPGLRAFCHVLEARQAVEQVDLDGNFLGDAGVMVFIPFLSMAKHIRKFRVNLRGLSPAVGAAVTSLLRSNSPRKRKVIRAKK